MSSHLPFPYRWPSLKPQNSKSTSRKDPVNHYDLSLDSGSDPRQYHEDVPGYTFEVSFNFLGLGWSCVIIGLEWCFNSLTRDHLFLIWEVWPASGSSKGRKGTNPQNNSTDWRGSLNEKITLPRFVLSLQTPTYSMNRLYLDFHFWRDACQPQMKAYSSFHMHSTINTSPNTFSKKSSLSVFIMTLAHLKPES